MEEDLQKGTTSQNWEYNIKTEKSIQNAQKLNSELRTVYLKYFYNEFDF